MSRTALLLVIGSCGIFLSACGGQESSPVPTNVASTLAENTPVIYDRYLSPKPLTPVQIGRILRMAESVSKGKVVWYIHVYRNNPVPDWEENWSVSVIFKPEQVSARSTGRSHSGVRGKG